MQPRSKIIWVFVLLSLVVSAFLFVRVKRLENTVLQLKSVRGDKALDVEYRPLVFTVNREGVVALNSKMLGFKSNMLLDIEINGFLPYNPIIKKGDPMYAYVKQVNDSININQGITILKHKELVLKPGFYYLKTNLGNLRIVVLEDKLSEFEKLTRLFYFYTSVAAHGRSANDIIGQDAIRIIFYTDYSPGNYCSGHVNMFESVFKDYLKKMRRIDFYGFARTTENPNYPAGHSVLEVYADSRWVLVDPMMGFVPLSREGKPLSFVEFVNAKRHKQYVLKYLFHIPIFGGDYQYVTNPPLDNKTAYMASRNFKWNWSAIEIISYETKKDQYYMEKERYAAMGEKDWDRYRKHYKSLLPEAQGTTLLKPKIKISIVEDLYQEQGNQ